MPEKRLEFDVATWHALDLLAKDRMQDFQELAVWGWALSCRPAAPRRTSSIGQPLVHLLALLAHSAISPVIRSRPTISFQKNEKTGTCGLPYLHYACRQTELIGNVEAVATDREATPGFFRPMRRSLNALRVS
jgi:hypothetical protein